MTTLFNDVDFRGYGDPSPESMLAPFREICAIQVDDGVAFDVSALRVELLREALN